MQGVWRTGASIGAMYLFKTEYDLDRVGNCWMKGRIKIGDIAICMQHSGDCFYDYFLIKFGGNFIRGIPESRFGAYVFGEEFEWKPSDKQFHLLAAGESVCFPIEKTCSVPFYKEYKEKTAPQNDVEGAGEQHTTGCVVWLEDLAAIQCGMTKSVAQSNNIAMDAIPSLVERYILEQPDEPEYVAALRAFAMWAKDQHQ